MLIQNQCQLFKNIVIYPYSLMGGENSQIIYAVPLDSTAKLGYSSIYRNPSSITRLQQYYDQNIKTLKDMIIINSTKFSNHDCLGKIITETDKQEKYIEFLTYKQCYEIGEMLGSSLYNKKLYSEADDVTLTNGKPMKLLGIYSKNVRQWILTDIACILFGITTIPIYDTLGVQNIQYCLQQTLMTTCCCTSATAQTLLSLKDTVKLKNLIVYDAVNYQLLGRLDKKFNIYYFSKLVDEGKLNKYEHSKIIVKPEDCHTFSYTSGTTGPPKGAMLSHQNAIAMLTGISKTSLKFFERQRCLSYLPLPHMYERSAIYAVLSTGSSTTFYSGDPSKIKEDAQLVKPTVFFSVPRLYNRMYDGIQKQFSQLTGLKEYLVTKALQSKKQSLQEGIYSHTIYDNLVFNKTKDALGGCVRYMLTGSAPLRKEVHEFMKVVMCAPLIEAYGQTENYALATTQVQNDPIIDHVGGPSPCIEIRLQDVPQMNYFSTDKNQNGENTPRGQICLRGPSIFLGYYKDPIKTSEAITKQGWLKTGDIGMIIPPRNCLKIIDRKKNIFKLSQGQYLASQKIQRIYSQYQYITQIFLYGQSTQSFAIAVIVPNLQKLRQMAKLVGITQLQHNLNKKQLRQLFCKGLHEHGKLNGLMSFQQPKNIFFETRSFQQLNFLGSTFKIQRHIMKKHYEAQIKQLYKEGMLIQQNKKE